ncbi:hypothetical protein JAAARDRAFT_27954, partial [Jaapia argillacea MUCL 33604]
MAQDSLHDLKALLQLQLASDGSAVLHLPFVLESLTSSSFSPNPHLQKWTARVNSLIHSQDPGGRWAGLSLAHRTSVLSKPLMLESAQSWIGAALPMLAKTEPLPNLKASIRLLRYIFSAATDVPEFQRQLATPNVPKFSQTLIVLTEKQSDQGLELLCLDTLSFLVPIYPTLHRALHGALSSLAFRCVSMGSQAPSIVDSAAHLYSGLPATGGKVGAANHWRKSVDETLALLWEAFDCLRTSFLPSRSISSQRRVTEEPMSAIPANLNRLKSGAAVMSCLLKSVTSRPTQIPIGPLREFIVATLRCVPDEKVNGHHDPSVHAMEVACVPSIWRIGCELLICLARCTRHHLTPHSSQLITIINYHLEQTLSSSQRLPFLEVIPVLLTHCHPPHDSFLMNRLVKAILPSLTPILSTQWDSQVDSTSTVGRTKKGKKRARGYEGDEVFKVSREVICKTSVDGEVILAAITAITIGLRNPHLSPAIQSIVSRVVLSMLLSLPQMPAASLSTDMNLLGDLLSKVQDLAMERGIGTTSLMSKSLGLVIRGVSSSRNEQVSRSAVQAHQQLDVLLHPRLPPLVRIMPQVDALSLFVAEEGEEEADIRVSLGLKGVNHEPALGADLTTPMDFSPDGPSVVPPLPPIPQHGPSGHQMPTSVFQSTVQHLSLQIDSMTEPQSLRSTPTATNRGGPIGTLVAAPKAMELSHVAPLPKILAPQTNATVLTSDVKTVESTSTSHIRVVRRDDSDDDEEFPPINMDSDSD